jgi:FkbM family methyltransferase
LIKKIILKLKTRSLVKYILWKTGISKILNSIKTQIFNREDRRWFIEEGDNRLRFKYDIKENDVIFEIGAFRGDDLKKFIDKFNCIVYAFEPSKHHYQNLLKIHNNNSKINIYNFGFYDRNTKNYLINNNDGSHITLKKPKNPTVYQEVELRKISEFIESSGIKKIKLMNMNIESSEYRVLKDLILSKEIDKVESLQVQFHRKTFMYFIKRYFIYRGLKKTHNLIWKYNYVWERWDKKV